MMRGVDRARLREAFPAGALPAAALAAVAALSGCSGSPSYSRFTSDACAVTLPVAEAAVHRMGGLRVVRPFHRTEALRYFGVQPPPLPSPSPTPEPAEQPRACLVVWAGRYAPGSVVGAGQQSGRFVLVLVRVRQPAVLRVRVVATYPPS